MTGSKRLLHVGNHGTRSSSFPSPVPAPQMALTSSTGVHSAEHPVQGCTCCKGAHNSSRDLLCAPDHQPASGQPLQSLNPQNSFPAMKLREAIETKVSTQLWWVSAWRTSRPAFLFSTCVLSSPPGGLCTPWTKPLVDIFVASLNGSYERLERK